MSSSSHKPVSKKVSEEKEKTDATVTISKNPPTGATSRAKKRETRMKVPKKKSSTTQDSDDEADADYVTFLNSLNWRDYEWSFS